MKSVASSWNAGDTSSRLPFHPVLQPDLASSTRMTNKGIGTLIDRNRRFLRLKLTHTKSNADSLVTKQNAIPVRTIAKEQHDSCLLRFVADSQACNDGWILRLAANNPHLWIITATTRARFLAEEGHLIARTTRAQPSTLAFC